MKKLACFVVAGGIGFVVDAAALLFLLRLTSLDPFSARLLSIGAALLVTWTLNRHLTFGASDRALFAEGIRYGSVGIATSITNYSIYSAMLLLFPALPPLAAMVAASGAAMALSYFGYSRFVFDR